MKIALILAGALSATLLGSPALASTTDQQASTTQVRVMPGQHVFRVADPIRVCVMAEVEYRTDHLVTQVIEQRTLNGKWKTIVGIRHGTNSMACLYGVIQGGADSYIRARTLRNSAVEASTSRKIFVDVAPLG